MKKSNPLSTVARPGRPRPVKKRTPSKKSTRPYRPPEEVLAGTLRGADRRVERATVIAAAMRDCALDLYRAGISYTWMDDSIYSEKDRKSYFKCVYAPRLMPRIAGSKPIAGTKEIPYFRITGTGRTKEELDKFCASVPENYAVDFIIDK